MTAPVFLAGTAVAGVQAHDEYVLDGDEGRHAAVVQRKLAGERVDVVDGRGTRLQCVVSAVEGPALRLAVTGVVHEPPAGVVLTLVQALAKADRDEMAVAAAVETGVDAVIAWQAERSVVVWRGERAARSLARWGGIVQGAAKQSRRAWWPDVGDAVTSPGLAALIREVVAAGGAALVLHEEATTPLASVALPQPDPAGPPRLLVVAGPEGGISDAERALFGAAGALAVRLGPHVLRTSTAGPVAVAMLSERLGRWALPGTPP
jgi:16S rRNA (uracil1498-N3)-methyltransferase